MGGIRKSIDRWPCPLTNRVEIFLFAEHSRAVPFGSDVQRLMMHLNRKLSVLCQQTMTFSSHDANRHNAELECEKERLRSLKISLLNIQIPGRCFTRDETLFSH